VGISVLIVEGWERTEKGQALQSPELDNKYRMRHLCVVESRFAQLYRWPLATHSQLQHAAAPPKPPRKAFLKGRHRHEHSSTSTQTGTRYGTVLIACDSYDVTSRVPLSCAIFRSTCWIAHSVRRRSVWLFPPKSSGWRWYMAKPCLMCVFPTVSTWCCKLRGAK
jgi:hypothetical protein